MADPRDERRPPPEEEETRLLPEHDTWPEDVEPTVVQRRHAPPPPRRRERVHEEREAPRRRREPPPAPPDRAIWPWLLVLLLLVVAGILAVWYFTREAEPEQVTMPPVVRLPEEAARERLEQLGLEVEVERDAADVPAGIVFAQTPGAGRTLEEGSTVTIHVSEGPDTTTVPNVVGFPEPQARQRLEQADLEVTREGVFSEQPPGTVVAQDPAAGEEVDIGSSVRINVSEGTGRVEVPDVVGLLVDEARAALAEQELEANVVQVPSNQPEGTVVAQSPAGGAEATLGDRVRLNVSRGP